MAFVLGEENKAKPRPRMTRLPMINRMVVFYLTRVSSMSLRVVRAIPPEASTRGATLSESLPAMGEKNACIAGVDPRTVPATCGLFSHVEECFNGFSLLLRECIPFCVPYILNSTRSKLE